MQNTNTINRIYWNQNILFISPLIRHVIIICISNIIPIAKGCFICVNIILNINNFLISGSSLIKIPALEVGDKYIFFSEVLKVYTYF
jgi:hypothetical protein